MTGKTNKQTIKHMMYRYLIVFSHTWWWLCCDVHNISLASHTNRGWIDVLKGGMIGAVFAFYGVVALFIILPLRCNRWLRRATGIVLGRCWELINPRCHCIYNDGTTPPRIVPFVDVFFADAMCSLSKVFFDWGMLLHSTLSWSLCSNHFCLCFTFFVFSQFFNFSFVSGLSLSGTRSQRNWKHLDSFRLRRCAILYSRPTVPNHVFGGTDKKWKGPIQSLVECSQIQ